MNRIASLLLFSAALTLVFAATTTPFESVAQEHKVRVKKPKPKGGACAWDNPPRVSQESREMDVGQEIVFTARKMPSAGACAPQRVTPGEAVCNAEGCEARIEGTDVIVTSTKPGNKRVTLTFYRGLQGKKGDRETVYVRFHDDASRALAAKIQTSESISDLAKSNLLGVDINLSPEQVELLLSKAAVLTPEAFDALSLEIELSLSQKDAEGFFEELSTLSDEELVRRVEDKTLVPDGLRLDDLE